MLTENDKGIELAVRLIGLTNSKKIRWRRESPQMHDLPQGRKYIAYVYVAEVGDDIFRLAEFEYKISNEEDFYGWDRGIDLDTIETHGKLLWHCPSNLAVYKLFQIVADEMADVDNVIARLDALRQAS
jgi:hypothetical protein